MQRDIPLVNILNYSWTYEAFLDSLDYKNIPSSVDRYTIHPGPRNPGTSESKLANVLTGS